MFCPKYGDDILLTQKKLMQKLQPYLEPDFDIDDDEMITNNLIKLNIFYQNFIRESVVESPQYVVGILHNVSAWSWAKNFSLATFRIDRSSKTRVIGRTVIHHQAWICIRKLEYQYQ